MTTVFDAPWFYWAVGVAVGLPICLVLLTELHNALLRRNNVLARPVHLLRNYILPLGALLILLVQGMQISGETTPVRIVATVFGFVVLVLLLSGLNATLFQGAPEGTWRKRIPSIFLDVARFVLIAVGVGLIFATSGAPTSADCLPRSACRRSCWAWRCRIPSGRSSPGCWCSSSSRSNWVTGSRRRPDAAGSSK